MTIQTTRHNRVVPGTGAQHHDTGYDIRRQACPRKAGAPIVEYPHDIAVQDTARSGVIDMNQEWFSALDL